MTVKVVLGFTLVMLVKVFFWMGGIGAFSTHFLSRARHSSWVMTFWPLLTFLALCWRWDRSASPSLALAPGLAVVDSFFGSLKDIVYKNWLAVSVLEHKTVLPRTFGWSSWSGPFLSELEQWVVLVCIPAVLRNVRGLCQVRDALHPSYPRDVHLLAVTNSQGKSWSLKGIRITYRDTYPSSHSKSQPLQMKVLHNAELYWLT